ncbi:MAG: GtrA family protein [Nanoarchaeota archaeon]|nr:GtrA family protein [Nanoarchaeota archaeon]
MPKKPKNTILKEINKITSIGGHVPKLITRFIRYLTTGAIALVLDLILLFILVELAKLEILTAAAIAFSIIFTLNFFLIRRWGFKGTKVSSAKSFIYFSSFGLISLLLTLIILGIIMNTFHFHYLVARFLTAIIVGVFNFTMNYIFTFDMARKIDQDLHTYSKT